MTKCCGSSSSSTGSCRRPGLGGLFALAVQALLGLAQRLAATFAGAQLLGQLVAAIGAVELVLALVDLARLAQDRPRDLPEVAVGVHRRVRRHLRPVDRHHPDRRQPDPRAQSEHAREHLAQRVLVAATEVRDRRVIRHQVAGDDAIGDVLHARPLESTFQAEGALWNMCLPRAGMESVSTLRFKSLR